MIIKMFFPPLVHRNCQIFGTKVNLCGTIWKKSPINLFNHIKNGQNKVFQHYFTLVHQNCLMFGLHHRWMDFGITLVRHFIRSFYLGNHSFDFSEFFLWSNCSKTKNKISMLFIIVFFSLTFLDKNWPKFYFMVHNIQKWRFSLFSENHA